MGAPASGQWWGRPLDLREAECEPRLANAESISRGVDTKQVNKTICVAAPREIALRVFTEKTRASWPLESHHIGKADAVAAVVEPRAGGAAGRPPPGSEEDGARVANPPRAQRVADAQKDGHPAPPGGA